MKNYTLTIELFKKDASIKKTVEKFQFKEDMKHAIEGLYGMRVSQINEEMDKINKL